MSGVRDLKQQNGSGATAISATASSVNKGAQLGFSHVFNKYLSELLVLNLTLKTYFEHFNKFANSFKTIAEDLKILKNRIQEYVNKGTLTDKQALIFIEEPARFIASCLFISAKEEKVVLENLKNAYKAKIEDIDNIKVKDEILQEKVTAIIDTIIDLSEPSRKVNDEVNNQVNPSPKFQDLKNQIAAVVTTANSLVKPGDDSSSAVAANQKDEKEKQKLTNDNNSESTLQEFWSKFDKIIQAVEGLYHALNHLVDDTSTKKDCLNKLLEVYKLLGVRLKEYVVTKVLTEEQATTFLENTAKFLRSIEHNFNEPRKQNEAYHANIKNITEIKKIKDDPEWKKIFDDLMNCASTLLTIAKNNLTVAVNQQEEEKQNTRNNNNEDNSPAFDKLVFQEMASVYQKVECILNFKDGDMGPFSAKLGSILKELECDLKAYADRKILTEEQIRDVSGATNDFIVQSLVAFREGEAGSKKLKEAKEAYQTKIKNIKETINELGREKICELMKLISEAAATPEAKSAQQEEEKPKTALEQKSNEKNTAAKNDNNNDTQPKFIVKFGETIQFIEFYEQKVQRNPKDEAIPSSEAEINASEGRRKKLVEVLNTLSNKVQEHVAKKGLTEEQAQTIAEQTDVFVRSCGNGETDFKKLKSDYETEIKDIKVKNSIFKQLVAAVIGAAIGFFAGLLAGAWAGPAAAFTALAGGATGAILAATAGAGAGFLAGYGLFQRNKFEELEEVQKGAEALFYPAPSAAV